MQGKFTWIPRRLLFFHLVIGHALNHTNSCAFHKRPPWTLKYLFPDNTEILQANTSSESESSWARTQAQESPAMCFRGSGPGMSTATQQRNGALGDGGREGGCAATEGNGYVSVTCRTWNSQEMISSLVGAEAFQHIWVPVREAAMARLADYICSFKKKIPKPHPWYFWLWKLFLTGAFASVSPTKQDWISIENPCDPQR